MTDTTNQCSAHSGLVGCAANLKKEIDEKVWPAIRKLNDNMVPRWAFVLVGSIVIACGLLLMQSNSVALEKTSQTNALAIEKNSAKIECLERIAKDVSAIKAVVVKE